MSIRIPSEYDKRALLKGYPAGILQASLNGAVITASARQVELENGRGSTCQTGP